jgi:membrane carboxypeptidase/penicillin-binding protein PbpC
MAFDRLLIIRNRIGGSAAPFRRRAPTDFDELQGAVSAEALQYSLNVPAVAVSARAASRRRWTPPVRPPAAPSAMQARNRARQRRHR